MKKKAILIVCGILLAAILAFGVIPVAAADGVNQAPPAGQQPQKGRMPPRLLAIQDEAKVDAFLAKGVANGKITPTQSTEIKAFWKANHSQFIFYEVASGGGGNASIQIDYSDTVNHQSPTYPTISLLK